MGKIFKTFVLFLTLIIAMSCLILIVKPVSAEAATPTNFPIVQTSAPLVDYNLTMHSPKANASFTNVMLLDYSLIINSNLSRLGTPLGLLVFYRIDDRSEEVLIGGDQYLYEFIDVTYLKNGIHQLTVLAQFSYLNNNTVFHNKQELISVYFSILNKPVAIHILSPQNSLYFTNNIPLTVEIDNPSSYGYQKLPLYRQYYRLDGGKMQLQNANDTIVGLKDGFHTVTYYVQIGNMSGSSTASFVVIATQVTQSLLVVAMVLIPVSVSILLLIYRRHRKNRT